MKRTNHIGIPSVFWDQSFSPTEVLKGVLLTFDNFVEGVEDFGNRIQPLMKSRIAGTPTGFIRPARAFSLGGAASSVSGDTRMFLESDDR
ncbi:Pyrimidine monooxygenase RutA [compost metagenome]